MINFNAQNTSYKDRSESQLSAFLPNNNEDNPSILIVDTNKHLKLHEDIEVNNQDP